VEVIVAETHQELSVTDESHVGAARRAARHKAQALGLGSETTARAELVASELATNLVKHAGQGGAVLMAGVAGGKEPGLEIIAIDGGPGMRSAETAMQDGFSTSASLGGGLGAIKRLSDQFAIHTRQGRGTAVLSRLWERRRPASRRLSFAVGGVMVARPGETVCGDGWAAAYGGDRLTVLVVDGLGHSAPAHQAAKTALELFREHCLLPPAELIRAVHERIAHTPGAVMAVARIDRAQGTVTYSGVGNIAGRIVCRQTSVGCVSTGGLAGYRLGRVREFTYPWADDAVLLMMSDGLVTESHSTDLEDLSSCPPSLAAAVLYRDFRRPRDDVTVVLVRNAE